MPLECGTRPGVVACSHHMGRWKTEDNGQRQMMATVKLDRKGSVRTLQRERGVEPFASSDADTQRIWWTDAGVCQNLTFAVQPDPISGMHCWHQAVRIRKADSEDRYGDISVDEDAAGVQSFAGRNAPAVLDAPAAQTGARCLPALARTIHGAFCSGGRFEPVCVVRRRFRSST